VSVDGPRRHRLDDLLGMRVRYADGRDGDQVLDALLATGGRVRGTMAELVVDGLVVGRRRPGTLFGYDRYPSMGPLLVRLVVRALHRHTGYVAWSDVAEADWDARVLRLTVDELRPLAPG